MGRPRTTKTEKLLRAIKRAGDDGMTRKQMVKFLLKLSGREYRGTLNRDTYNALLYGTSDRQGILERFCDATLNDDDRTSYVIAAPIKAPFTPRREQY